MLAPPPSLLSPLPQLQRMPEGVHPSVLPHHYLLIHAGRQCSYISSCWITFLKLKMRNIFLRSFVWDFYSVHLQIPESGGKTIISLNILDFFNESSSYLGVCLWQYLNCDRIFRYTQSNRYFILIRWSKGDREHVLWVLNLNHTVQVPPLHQKAESNLD